MSWFNIRNRILSPVYFNEEQYLCRCMCVRFPHHLRSNSIQKQDLDSPVWESFKISCTCHRHLLNHTHTFTHRSLLKTEPLPSYRSIYSRQSEYSSEDITRTSFQQYRESGDLSELLACMKHFRSLMKEYKNSNICKFVENTNYTLLFKTCFFYVFEWRLLCSSRLHLFDKKYGKIWSTVKYYCNFK